MLNIIDLDNMFHNIVIILARIEAKIELMQEQEKLLDKDRETLIMLAKSLDSFLDAIEIFFRRLDDDNDK